MKIIAVSVTIIVGYIACLFFPETDLPCIFSIATIGYFILKKLDEISIKKD